jgi:hypothetical protein
MNFLNKFNNKKNIRFSMFEYSLVLAKKRNLKILVETGTSRGKIKFFFFKKYNWKDGMSTIIFGEFANFIQGKLYTCDVSEENINSAKMFTKNLKNNILFFVEDSVNFLKNFKLPIDFLYLDSLDGHNPKIASEHQLNEIKSSINKLHENSLVLLDDKLLKTNLSLDFLKKNNFKILKETDFQILLSKTL